MPSNQLSSLCDLIEKQETDHFAKFYMYVSLLNTLTVRDKTFVGGLPKYTGMLGGVTELKIGKDLPIQFTEQLTYYAREFDNPQPGVMKAIQNLVWAYLRKGKLADLAHIIDKMLFHLAAIHGKQAKNNDIYKDINFNENKESLTQFIGQISAFNHQLLQTVDSGCNSALSVMSFGIGFVLILASVASITPLIIGLPLLLGGAYGAYHYVTKAMEQADILAKQYSSIEKQAVSIGQNEQFYGKNSNHYAFFTTTYKTLPYTAVTIGEQLSFDESTHKAREEFRTNLDRVF